VSFGASKTSAWSPAWETNPSRAVTSAVLGPLHETTERIHQCSGGIKTLGTFIGTDYFVRAASMALICSRDTTSAVASVTDRLTASAARLRHQQPAAPMTERWRFGCARDAGSGSQRFFLMACMVCG